jgi:hypothetical protein
MKPQEQDQLLSEILAGGDLSDFRQRSLERGLSSVRQRSKRRKAARLCALLCLPFLLILPILYSASHERAEQGVVKVVPTAAMPDVKFINDEELFALFPGQPVALIGKPGQQELVFLESSQADWQQ